MSNSARGLLPCKRSLGPTRPLIEQTLKIITAVWQSAAGVDRRKFDVGMFM